MREKAITAEPLGIHVGPEGTAPLGTKLHIVMDIPHEFLTKDAGPEYCARPDVDVSESPVPRHDDDEGFDIQVRTERVPPAGEGDGESYANGSL